jgi:NAD(P)-dependent dehydrogenase (short-subunit alcohol dehydrogenase family)
MTPRKAIFISGGASGIGLATAELFAERGWFVGLGDVNAEGLAAAQVRIGVERCFTIRLDVRDRAAWTAALDAFATASGGRLDALINNAGVGRHAWFEDIDPDEDDRVIDVNVKGVINGARTGLPRLKASGGVLVNIASCAGLYGVPRLAVYGASKFAVRGLSEALDAEFARHGVRVRCLAPWFIDTPILQAGGGADAAETLRARGVGVYPPSVAAKAVWDAVHGRRLLYPVGWQAQTMSLAARLIPGVLRTQLRRRPA